MPRLREEAPRKDEVDVVDADAECEGGHPPQNGAHVGVEGETRSRPVSDGPERRPLGDDLEEAAHERPDRKSEDRVMAARGEDSGKPEGRDEKRHVEEAWREGSDGKATVRLKWPPSRAPLYP